MQTLDSPDNGPTKQTESSSAIKSAVSLVRRHRTVSTVMAVSVIAAAATPFMVQAASPPSESNSNSIRVESKIDSQQAPAASTGGQASNDQKRQQADGANQQNKTTVTVNGQPVELSEDGSYSKTTQNSQTNIKVTNSQTSVSTGSSSSNSQVNINVQSESSSTSEGSDSTD